MDRKIELTYLREIYKTVVELLESAEHDEGREGELFLDSDILHDLAELVEEFEETDGNIQ